MKNLDEVGRNLSFTSRNSAQWRNNPYYKYHKANKQERNDNIKESLTEESDVLDFDFKDKNLNPIVWEEDQTIKPEVRKDLIKIANKFYEYLDVKAPIEDILLVGSSANYNYTDKSDIDLHLVIDFSKIDKNKELLRDFFDTKKAYWSLMHDITIKDHDVEMYVQDLNDDLKSAGIYSIKDNKWISKPNKENIQIDKELVRKKVDYIATLIDGLEGIKDDEDKAKEAARIKDKIKKMRKTALDKGGEFSEDNIAFKVLRNDGYLEKLFDIKNKAIDKELTIKESDFINEGVEVDVAEKAINEKSISDKQQRFFGIVRALQKGEIKPSKAYGKAYKASKEMSKGDVKDFASTKHSEIKEDDENAKNHKYEYGCLMAYFNIPTWETKILSKIDDEDLYTEEISFGKELEPHVSILFGFHDDVDVNKVIDLVNENVKHPLKIEIKKVSVFESEKYDVLKFDVESPDLRALNKLMTENFEYTSNFPEFFPHMTIAYLKRGVAQKYIKSFTPGAVILDSEKFVYSNPDGTKILWSPEDKEIKKEIEFEADNGINKITVVKTDIDPEKLFYIQDFIGFVCDNIHMEKSVHVCLMNGRDENGVISTTASYDIKNNVNYINVKKRALVDILRSIAHELTHNRQREIGKIVPEIPVHNIFSQAEDESNSFSGAIIKCYTSPNINGMNDIYDI